MKKILAHVQSLFDEEDLDGNPRKIDLNEIAQIKIKIKPFGRSLGIDTTRLFKSDALSRNEKYHHKMSTTYTTNMKTVYCFNAYKHLRQEQLLVPAISSMTDKVWRLTTNKDNCIILSISRVPKKVLKLRLDKIYSSLKKISKFVTGEASLC